MMLSRFIVALTILAPFEFTKGSDSPFDPRNIVNLTENNYEKEVKEKAHLVMFYASDCPKCIELDQLWTTLAEHFNSSDNQAVVIAKADCGGGNKLCEEGELTTKYEECGMQVSKPGSEIVSKNHPQKYPSNFNCNHTISFIKDHTIKLKFLAFNLETHATCGYDWLQVYDGNNDSAPLLGSKLCGYQIPEPLTSSGHELFLKFHSDRTTEGRGYKIIADISDGNPCQNNTCLNGGTCYEFDFGDDVCICSKYCNGSRCEECNSKPRFELEDGFPTIMFIQKYGIAPTIYHGPHDKQGLLSFVNEQTGWVPDVIKNESTLVYEAGCVTKDFKENGKNFHWIPSGTLLEKGVCIGANYKKSFVPEEGRTIVYSTVENQKVREVDAKKRTLTIDFVLNMIWLDPNIRVNFSTGNIDKGGIILSQGAVQKIWTPDLYIINRAEEEWKSLKTSKVLSTNEYKRIQQISDSKHILDFAATIELKYEIKATVYCNFKYDKYPLDEQNCDVEFGSSSFGAIFNLYDSNGSYHNDSIHDDDTLNLNVKVTFFDNGNSHQGNNTVGIRINMNRLTRSFIMKYYIPCIAIVLVSEIGFVIPITSIPGRVSLLVTQFLTLINLFIYQMSDSPSTSELNILGQYLLVSLGFVVIALIEFALLLMLNRRKMSFGLTNGSRSSTSSKKVKFTDTKIGKVQPASYQEPNKKCEDDKTIGKRQRMKRKGKEIACNLGATPIYKFDFIAFCLHLIAFVLFNLIYYNQHLG